MIKNMPTFSEIKSVLTRDFKVSDDGITALNLSVVDLKFKMWKWDDVKDLPVIQIWMGFGGFKLLKEGEWKVYKCNNRPIALCVDAVREHVWVGWFNHATSGSVAHGYDSQGDSEHLRFNELSEIGINPDELSRIPVSLYSKVK